MHNLPQLLGSLFGFCIMGTILGFIVQSIIYRKGYSKNWFWWGFFFQLIALIVALTKPRLRSNDYDSSEALEKLKGDVSYNQGQMNRYWTCSECGRKNTAFSNICSCGRVKD